MAENKNQKFELEQMAETSQKDSAFDKALAAWTAPEFFRYRRTWLWYSIAILLDAALLVFAYYSGSITMGLVFLVLPAVFALEQRKAPQTVEVVISSYGIKFGNKKFPFSEIKKFWIIHHPPHINELHILSSNRINPELTIPMMGTDPVALRNFLVTQIGEWEGKKENTLDILIRLLKLA